ncbi:MAG: NAD-dependent deacetylase [Acidimicrobiia bacterium]|nr:Sir2 family NAD-dependent protein deacetylase [bacterium]MYC84290.1 NAD-dependent deacetylase [Acidimicrobiia bacterium]
MTVDQIEQAAELLGSSSRLLVFTGAGISTESGIPDFRGPDGLWKTVDPDDFTFERYLDSAATRRRSWMRWSTSPLRQARPNQGHEAITELARLGRLAGCVTQNIDGLHRAAGLADELLVEAHGNVWTVRCLVCPAEWPSETVFDRVESGEEDPHCSRCGGIIKLTVISFGQAMPAAEMHRGYAMAQAADAVLAVGTTLSVWPAADIPLSAVRRGVPFVIVNLGPTDGDGIADLKIDAPAGSTMRRLVGLLG